MTSGVVWPACIGIAVLAASLGVLFVRRGMHPIVAAGALVVAAAAIWTIGLTLQFHDWKDTDGWVDCYPSCHGWHATGAVLFFAPPVAGLVSVAAVLVAWLTRGPGRSAEHGSPLSS